jgi:hypothetical protein
MATFRCTKCGCDDDTALCNYWSARVRDALPVCSACDSKIGKWHGQFPRIFGVFLVTPSQTNRPGEVPASLVERLRQAEVGPKLDGANDRNQTGREAGMEAVKPGGAFFPDDPVPPYKPFRPSHQA